MSDWVRWAAIAAAVVLVIWLLSLTIKIVQQYQRGVVFRLGRVRKERLPGLRLIIPFIDRMQHVSLRVVTIPIQAQEIITKDNVEITLLASVFFLIRFAPGGPFDTDRVLPPEVRRNIEVRYGLDAPIAVQFGRWVRATASAVWRLSPVTIKTSIPDRSSSCTAAAEEGLIGSLTERIPPSFPSTAT